MPNPSHDKDNAERAYEYVFMQYIGSMTRYLSNRDLSIRRDIYNQIFLMSLLKSEFGIHLNSCCQSELMNEFYDSIVRKVKSLVETNDEQYVLELIRIPK